MSKTAVMDVGSGTSLFLMARLFKATPVPDEVFGKKVFFVPQILFFTKRGTGYRV